MRKAQLTIAVIIGLVLLLIVGLFFILRTSEEPVREVSSENQVRLTQYVQSCLKSTGTQALKTVGANGGYTPNQVANLMPNTGKDALIVVHPPQRVPLWHEISECSENSAGCVNDQRPYLCRDQSRCPIIAAGIQTDIAIDENIAEVTEDYIDDCLGQFNNLPFEVTRNGEPEIKALIRDEDIILDMVYPLKLTASDGASEDVTTYSTRLIVNLAQVYELATKIHKEEAERSFIEQAWLHLLSVYSGVDSDIPPIKSLQLMGSPNYWVTHEVEDKIESGIMPYMNFLQIVNAQESYVPMYFPNVEPEYAAYAAGTMDYLAILLNDSRVYPLGVRFDYLYSPINLDINGDQFLKPRKMPGTGWLSIFGIKVLEYRFKYSSSFPMLVSVYDPYALEGDGFELQFGLEANIYKNNPLSYRSMIDIIEINRYGLDMAAPNMLVDHTYRVLVTDKRDGQPVGDIGVTYACGAGYQMGITNGNGLWEGKLPYCMSGGVLLIEDPVYVGQGIELLNINDDGQITELAVEAWPRVEKTVYMYKRTVNDQEQLQIMGLNDATSASEKTEFTPVDQVLVTISKQKDNQYEPEVPLLGILQFGQAEVSYDVESRKEALLAAYDAGDIDEATYNEALEMLEDEENNEGGGTVVTTQTTDLIPGKYDITAFLSYLEKIEIPADERCSGGIFGECVTLNATNLSTWVSGGAVLVEDNGVQLSEEFIYSNEPLTMFVLEQPIPTNWTALEQHENLEEYQTYGRREMVVPLCGSTICS